MPDQPEIQQMAQVQTSTLPVSTEAPSSLAQKPNGEGKNMIESSWLNPLLIVLAGCSLVVVLILGFIFIKDKNNFLQNLTQKAAPTTAPPTTAPLVTKSNANISGVIDFQGYASGDAYLVIVERSVGKNDFKSVVTGLVPQSGVIPWTWKDATSGTNYELRAQLKVKGIVVQESAIVSVSAPAQDVSLTLISEQDPPTPQVANISGTIHLDGYIPPNSTMSILSRVSGSGNYTTAVSGLSAQDNTSWTWENASLGQTYDLLAQLVSSAGVAISSDPGKTVTAPSSGLSFEVSSNAQPPTPTVTGLSGTITINGSIPSNSYITLGTRLTGATAFTQVGGNLSVSNGVSWSIPNVQSGSDYDVQAYLWVNGQPFAESNIVNLTPPSVNDVLTINAQQQLSAPSSDSISVSCNGQQSGAFQATINYNKNASLQNAQSYNVVVTLASQGNQVLNTTLTPANPGQSQSLTTSYIFTPGTTYYAQYAYASSSSNNSLSPLSPAIQFSCR